MLKFFLENNSPKKILCLGAHCDDIEIGCGGALLKLLRTMKDVHVYWVVFSSDASREKEALKSANDFLKSLKKEEDCNKKIQEQFLPILRGRNKRVFRAVNEGVFPRYHLHALQERLAPGPPTDFRVDMEHLQESPDSRIRDTEVRRGFWIPQFFHTAR